MAAIRIPSLIIVITLLSVSCFAQTAFRKNTFYGEFAGNGLFLSVNYERQLENKPGPGFHVGVGSASSDETFRVTIPVGVDYLFNIGHQKSFVEAGLGITWAEENLWKGRFQNLSHQYKPAFVPSVGYRHHTRYGLMWRINCNSFFTKYRNIFLYPGISVGWRI